MNSTSVPFPPSMSTLDSPQIFDTEMGDSLPGDDLFFNSALGADSPSLYFGDEGMSNTPFQSPIPVKARKIHAESQGVRDGSALSTSPESSMQDSSSDSSGRHKRKTSSRSSHSNGAGKDLGLGENSRQAQWQPPSVRADPSMKLSSHQRFEGFEHSNRVMDADFDFDSAASSPSPLMAGNNINYTGNRHVAIPYRDSPGPAPSLQPPNSRSSTGTRETSPLSAVVNSSFRPNFIHTSRTSPASSNEDFVDGVVIGGMEQLSPFPVANQKLHAAYTHGLSIPNPGLSSMIPLANVALTKTHLPSTLMIHPTPQKSRVETQIPIKLTLFPVPDGVTSVHLPAYTISKPKLLAKPPPPKDAQMLELSTALVCTSAMQDPGTLERALARAASHNDPEIKQENGRRSSAGDENGVDESLPLNGGDVKICDGCITRERKRAARKKSKKPEEEEPWQKDEAKRIIVFNTTEVKMWQDPFQSSGADGQTDGSVARRENSEGIPEGARQIDVPMRIACYCRHQSEKLGFQVIFTIKDHQDKLIAQAITNPIVITDDHKTHAPPSSIAAGGPMHADHAHMPGGAMFGREPLENYGNSLYRNAHSATDLQSLQHSFNPHYGIQNMAPFAVPQNNSQTTSATLTPRNISRQASPSSPGNSMHKKRKASGGAVKLPGNLQMTRIETSDSSVQRPWSPGNYTMSPNSASPFASTFSTMTGPRHASQRSANFYSGPPTPNNETSFFGQANRSQSFENLNSMQPMFPVSQSARPSRAPSPTSEPQVMNASNLPFQAGPVRAAVSVMASTGAQRPPTIHKLIPSEGPKAGGIEVTCLGSGFQQGMEIMFGDSLATTTTYWGETSLVCLLPPALCAGAVAVTFKHQYQKAQQSQVGRFVSPPISKQQVFFKYIDDDEQELLRQALLIVHQKMTGQVEDVGELARRIIDNANQQPWSIASNGAQHRQAAPGNTLSTTEFDPEAAVLKCLDLIDQDDSPYPARLNLKRKNGQGLLHLAASLGMNRLVAGLVARGANPDLRDRNGMSPLHMAALNGHPQIVRRLRLAGSDTTLRSLLGFTPADMASSKQVLEAIEALPLARSRSAGAQSTARISRPSSTSSLYSLGKSISFAQRYDVDNSSEDESGDEPSETRARPHGHHTPAQKWARSRRNSGALEPALVPPPLEGSAFVAGMNVWRDQLAAQIQHFQQSAANWTLPNLQLPTLPAMPDYQANTMMRRVSSMIPQRNSRPSTSSSSTTNADPKEGWWDILKGGSSPPAYEEIYPAKDQVNAETNEASAIRAATDAAADEKCSTVYDDVQTGSSSRATNSITIRKESSLEEIESARAIRNQNLGGHQSLFGDRKLWRRWVPILLAIIIAVVLNWVPQAWHPANVAFDYLQTQERRGGRVIEV